MNLERRGERRVFETVAFLYEETFCKGDNFPNEEYYMARPAYVIHITLTYLLSLIIANAVGAQ